MIRLILLLFPFVAFAQIRLPALNSPPEKVTMLGDGTLSTSINERDFALSPSGNEIFYTISTPRSSFQTIVYSRKLANGDWSTPEVASFAGEYSDLEPVFNHDGHTL